jgi:4-hydroxybenzoate polyprenyltransferase
MQINGLTLNDPPHPLVVDLDGTILKTDLLFESVNWYISKHFFKTLMLLVWVLKGKAYLKSQLALIYPVDPAQLPYNENLLSWLKSQRSQGRPIILATASHSIPAKKVADHLAIFDEVYATDSLLNLKSNNKRDKLLTTYGTGNFDYIGNSSDDLPIWRVADKAFLVNASKSLIRKAEEVNSSAEILFHSDQTSRINLIARAMRPHQWLKNLLIFVPLLTSHEYQNLPLLKAALLAFMAFSLTASSAYILNDIVDIAEDRHHPKKKFRPFSSGDLSILSGWILWPCLLACAFSISLMTLPSFFVGVQAVYFCLTVAYSFFLKQKPIIDVLTLSGLYKIRIVAGIVAFNLPLSFWLLTFSMFFFLSLALVKRFTEIYSLKEKRMNVKLKGRGYFREDIEIVSSMGISSGYISIIVLALYIQDILLSQVYIRPELIWLTCPLLLLWISRTWIITHRGQMHNDPVVFAAKDLFSWITVVILLLLFLVAKLY